MEHKQHGCTQSKQPSGNAQEPTPRPVVPVQSPNLHAGRACTGRLAWSCPRRDDLPLTLAHPFCRLASGYMHGRTCRANQNSSSLSMGRTQLNFCCLKVTSIDNARHNARHSRHARVSTLPLFGLRSTSFCGSFSTQKRSLHPALKWRERRVVATF